MGLVAILTALSLVACGDDSAENTGAGPPEDADCQTGVEQEVTEGLTYVELECGDGAEAATGDAVTVHYTGTLADDGTEFDSSVGGEPFTFTIGNGFVIQGWELGVPGMREGGKRELRIAPELGYGEAGYADVIPPNAPLVFEIELLEVAPGASP